MNYANHSKDSRANLGGFDLSEQSNFKKKGRLQMNMILGTNEISDRRRVS